MKKLTAVASGHQGDSVSSRNNGDCYIGIGWQETFELSARWEDVKPALEKIFCERQSCVLISTYATRQVFQRGDKRIPRLPTTRTVRWQEIPVTITVSYGTNARDGAVVEVSFDAPEDMEFTGICHDYFYEHAKLEFNAISEVMKRVTRTYSSASQREDHHEHEHAPDERSSTPATVNDYETLGLKPGATWPEVQSAYRQMCKLYHPDTLTSPNVPPHLVELAVKRFKQITESYQRLKEHLG